MDLKDHIAQVEAWHPQNMAVLAGFRLEGVQVLGWNFPHQDGGTNKMSRSGSRGNSCQSLMREHFIICRKSELTDKGLS